MKKFFKILLIILAVTAGGGSVGLMIRFIIWIAQNVFGIGVGQ